MRGFPGFVARGGFSRPAEGSRLQSLREPNSVPRAWQMAGPRYQQNDQFTNQIARLRRDVGQLQMRRLGLTGFHPFKLYNFPRTLRRFKNSDDWRRFKVRNGFINYITGSDSPLSNRVFGTDFIGDILSAESLDDDIYLGSNFPQVPPSDGSLVTSEWNEGVVPEPAPNTSSKVYVWITLCADSSLGAVVAYTEASLFVGPTFTATSLVTGSTFTEKWPNPGGTDDNLHRLIGSVWAYQGKQFFQQCATDSIDLPYWHWTTNVIDTASGPTFYRGIYNDSVYYYPGNIVKKTTGTFSLLYIFSPSTVDGYAWDPTQGPIIGVDPGTGVTGVAPWVLFSRSPIT